jgi:hypothetical protein
MILQYHYLSTDDPASIIPQSDDPLDTAFIRLRPEYLDHLDPEDPFVPLPQPDDPEDPAISTQPDDPEVPLPDVPDDPDLPTDIVVCIFELLFEPSKYVTKTELP